MSRAFNLFAVLVITILLTPFQNCSPLHTVSDLSSQDGKVMGYTLSELSAKFAATLQPTLTTNCGACHGQTQTPMFAVSSADSAVQTIASNLLVDLRSPASSALVIKLNAGHSGFSTAMGTQVQNGIQAWATALGVGVADLEAPAAMLSSPAASATISGTVSVQSIATDNIGVVGVQFLVDGLNSGSEDLSSPYSISLNTSSLANGSHSLSVRARDAAGNITTSAVVSVTVNNVAPDVTPPTVSITSPAAAATVSGTISIAANAADNIGVVGVQFLVDGLNSGAEDLNSPYSVSLNTSSLANGSHNIAARARDAAGNIKTSAIVTVTVNNVAPDVTPPTVSVTSPAAAATVSGTINLTANAADNFGVAGVQFLVDGVNSGAEDMTSPYSVSLNTSSLANGSHSISARARDAAGNVTTSAAISVTVSNAPPDVTPPTVSITAPTAAATVSGTINLTANAADNIGVAGVQFLVDGVNSGAEDTSSPYSVALNTVSIANGSHTISAKARDAAGNVTTSAVVSVTVNNANAMATYSYISTNLLSQCLGCHGAAKADAGYRFNTYANTLKAVSANNAAGSLLYKTITTGKMSKSPYPQFSAVQEKGIFDWINGGALNN